MDSDPRITRLAAAASRCHHSRYDREDIAGEDESRPEFLCPFCAEDFDVVGLCCHIDEEHAIEAKNGVCPICAKRVGMNLVSHITMQHGSLLKVQRKRRFRKYGSNSTLSMLKKELREGNLQSLFGGSQRLVSSSNTDPDPLLSSFMSNLRVVDELVGIKPHSTVEASLEKEGGSEYSSQRNIQKYPLSDKDQEERATRCEFVLGLLTSTFLDNNL